MKYAPLIAGALLGLPFIAFGLNHFMPFLPAQGAPETGTPPDLFIAALHPTGYLGFVKAMEILGGLLTAIPKTRNMGLLILGPIIVNILCFHGFLAGGASLTDPVLIVICLLAAGLLYSAREKFANLLN